MLVLLLFLGSLSGAQAWYEPSVQRWVNRDPVNEQGFEAMRQYRDGVPRRL